QPLELVSVEVPVERDLAQAQADRQQLLGTRELAEKEGEATIPQMTLVSRQVEAAQLRPQPLEGPAEVARMDTQVIDQTAAVAAGELLLALCPVAPVGEQRCLLLFLRGAIELVGSSQGLPQRFLVATLHHQPGDELPAGNRTEALIIE